MKKLMFGLAIAAVGTAFAVESSNIVGYTNNDVGNVLFVGAPLQVVGGVDTATVGDFKTNCPDDAESATGWQPLSDAIVQLTEGGSFLRKLVYLPQYIATDINAEKGWYDEEDVGNDDFTKPYNDTLMPFGKAVQVAVDGTDAKVNFAGEVKKTETISPVAGVMGIANCACKRLYIKDVKTNCPDDEESATGWQPLSDAVVELTEGGSFKRKLVYLPQYIATDISAVKGWYDEEDVGNDDFTKPFNDAMYWEAGYGFQVAVDGSGALVQIDPAITNDAE